MKLHVLYDRTGRILAAVHLDAPDSPESQGMGELRPVPRKGQMSGDFEVPGEYSNLGFVEACRALRVDMKLRKLVAGKPSAKRKTGSSKK